MLSSRLSVRAPLRSSLWRRCRRRFGQIEEEIEYNTFNQPKGTVARPGDVNPANPSRPRNGLTPYEEQVQVLEGKITEILPASASRFVEQATPPALGMGAALFAACVTGGVYLAAETTWSGADIKSTIVGQWNKYHYTSRPEPTLEGQRKFIYWDRHALPAGAAPAQDATGKPLADVIASHEALPAIPEGQWPRDAITQSPPGTNLAWAAAGSSGGQGAAPDAPVAPVPVRVVQAEPDDGVVAVKDTPAPSSSPEAASEASEASAALTAVALDKVSLLQERFAGVTDQNHQPIGANLELSGPCAESFADLFDALENGSPPLETLSHSRVFKACLEDNPEWASPFRADSTAIEAFDNARADFVGFAEDVEARGAAPAPAAAASPEEVTSNDEPRMPAEEYTLQRLREDPEGARIQVLSGCPSCASELEGPCMQPYLVTTYCLRVSTALKERDFEECLSYFQDLQECYEANPEHSTPFRDFVMQKFDEAKLKGDAAAAAEA